MMLKSNFSNSHTRKKEVRINNRAILAYFAHTNLQIMNIQLISVDAKKPDRRAIAKMIEDVADNMDGGLARELTDILLDGDPIEIMVSNNISSAYRAIRKLEIDYEIIE